VAAESLHLPVQLLLAGVRERGVPDVVRQRQGLRQVLIQLQHLATVRAIWATSMCGQAVAEMIGETGCEDLGFGLQPPEGPGMDDAVAVALEGVAVGMFGFRVAPAPASLHRKTAGAPASQHREAYRGATSPYALNRHLADRFRALCAADPERLRALGGLRPA